MSLKNFLIAFSLTIASYAQADDQVTLLTGIISSSKYHLVTAPKTNRWQVQIQWMIEEGTIVNEGDLVVVFDSGGIESQLEVNEEKLETDVLELLKLEMDKGQAVLEANGALKLANIMVEKTRIEASVPDGEVSAYEKGKNVIEYEKAITAKIKAQENYKLKLEEQKIELDKKNIEILKLKEQIAYQRSQLEKLSVRAKVSGPVTHAMHQWMAQKVAAGMNIQASWEVLTVQAASTYQVSAWLHEIDAARIDLQKSTFELTLDAYPNQSYQGKIISVSSQAEQKSQWSDSAYYRVELGFAEAPQQAIFPGMSVRVKLQHQNLVQQGQPITELAI
ncbi:MAG: HlyD family efflux transporter periplasmic adaptor subunit [Paraglaciecola sp.]|uniref:HlyD family secretion protein n=1 Tax=Paraglaciecola sp. TaxID=1920173 RepID=UPI0032973223